MSTLHDHLEAAIKERLAVAQAASPGPWAASITYPQMVCSPQFVDQRSRGDLSDVEVWLISTTLSHRPVQDATFIAANGPDRVIRDCGRDLSVLRRHRLIEDHPEQVCYWCRDFRWPCAEIRDLAEAYGIEVQQ